MLFRKLKLLAWVGAAAMLAAALYFLESSGHIGLIGALTGVEHKYSKLLVLCVFVLGTGFAAYAIGILTNRRTDNQAASST